MARLFWLSDEAWARIEPHRGTTAAATLSARQSAHWALEQSLLDTSSERAGSQRQASFRGPRGFSALAEIVAAP